MFIAECFPASAQLPYRETCTEAPAGCDSGLRLVAENCITNIASNHWMPFGQAGRTAEQKEKLQSLACKPKPNSKGPSFRNSYANALKLLLTTLPSRLTQARISTRIPYQAKPDMMRGCLDWRHVRPVKVCFGIRLEVMLGVGWGRRSGRGIDRKQGAHSRS